MHFGNKLFFNQPVKTNKKRIYEKLVEIPKKKNYLKQETYWTTHIIKIIINLLAQFYQDKQIKPQGKLEEDNSAKMFYYCLKTAKS